MKIAHFGLRQLAALMLSLALIGCDSAENDVDNRGRIVLGESVDGVRIGSDTLSVRGRLGRPTQIQRGVSFVSYRYTQGRHAGVSINFGLDTNGRFDGSTAFSLSMPYPGVTEHGIGLGSTRSAVLDALGEPHFTNVGTSGQVLDRYESLHARTGFLYDQDERVSGITMNGPL